MSEKNLDEEEVETILEYLIHNNHVDIVGILKRIVCEIGCIRERVTELEDNKYN